MGGGWHIGLTALAFVRQIRHLDHVAVRITASMGAVVVVAATVPPASTDLNLKLSAETTALVLGRTSVPTPDDAYVETVKNQYIEPTHPGQDINYVAVTTPQEFWPLSALLFRLPGLVLGPQEIWGRGGPGWPDEPLWKLSGLFDLTVDRSLYAGVADLERRMTQYGNDNLVIYGYQQGAAVANVEKRKLAEQYPVGTKAPDIDFVLGGDPNLPNGGFASRFYGLYIPILDVFYNGPAPTDTQFDTTVIIRQYDFEDFPLYPLNIIADLNALLGAPYVNFFGFDVSLAPNPSTSPAIESKHGDTTYYFFPTADLPLFGPLRSLGVPEPVIDVVEPVFRVIVEWGYDRSIPLWEPTPARLFPTTLNPGKVATDLVNAVGEGFNNALALFGAPPLLRTSEPVTTATPKPAEELPATQPSTADLSPQAPRTEAGQAKAGTETVGADVFPQALLSSEKFGVRVLRARTLVCCATQFAIQDNILGVRSVADVGTAVQNGVTRIQKAVVGDPDAPNAHVDPYETESPTAPSIAQQRARTVGPVLAATRPHTNDTASAVKSVVGNGRTVVRTAGSADGVTAATPSPARKTAARDAVREVKKAVTQMSDSLRKALSGGRGKDNHNVDGGQGGAPQTAE